jgi:hypothetical protein
VTSDSTQISWILVGATIITWCFLLFGYDDSYPWLSLVEVAAGLFGMVVIAVALTHNSWAIPSALGVIAVIVITLIFFVWCWIQVRVAPAYGTDESAFDQYAAQLFVHGHNPYTSSMAPSFSLFHVSPDGFTFRLNGTPVTQLSYPALSFLLYVPLLLVGWSSQAAIALNVAAWAITVALAYRLLPRSIKPLALVLGSFVIYTGFAVGGVTDALYVPFLLIAVYRWDRYIDRTGWRRWASPVAMGLSMGVKQTPWFILPFLLLGIYLEARRSSLAKPRALLCTWDYAWRTTVVFLIPNLYFIAVNPTKWIGGVLTPFIDHLVPAGEGWVAISDFMGQGGGSVQTYTFLFLAVFVSSVVVFVLAYPRSKALMVFFPSLILFFSERSFSNYLVMLLLPAIVAACTIKSLPSQREKVRSQFWGTKLRRRVTVVSFALVPIGLILVTFYQQPIGLRVDSVTTTGQLATVIQVRVTVTNRTNASLRPVFSSEGGGALTAPWNIIHGPKTLAPHVTTTYNLQAPNFFAQPALSGGFQIVALTQSPGAMSVSPPFTPTYWHVVLNPEAFNRPIPVGKVIKLSVHVVGPTDSPVNIAGIPVFLGQVSYIQQGLDFTEVIINHGTEGQTPVEALTNKDGVANYTVKGTVASVNPVYFEANLVNGQSEYPYGYSDIVPIRFR